MKLSKCILLATVALSASLASAACKDAAQAALTRNPARDAQLAANLTGQGSAPAAQVPQDSSATVSR